jgi:hypothetical protein
MVQNASKGASLTTISCTEWPRKTSFPFLIDMEMYPFMLTGDACKRLGEI